jgi:hypothetical protein
VSNDENYQGVIIYVATAANTWTKYWEPYNYPHPLRGTTPQAIKVGFD